MPTIEVRVRRISLLSSKPFNEVIERLTAAIGHPDMSVFPRAMLDAAGIVERKEVVRGAVGSSELMEFVRFDAGEVVRKGRNGEGPKILRLVIGKPIIMKQMADTVPDATAYAPIAILVDERGEGVHLSYDWMESLLAPYSSRTALQNARNLDAKVESLLEEAAR